MLERSPRSSRRGWAGLSPPLEGHVNHPCKQMIIRRWAGLSPPLKGHVNHPRNKLMSILSFEILPHGRRHGRPTLSTSSVEIPLALACDELDSTQSPPTTHIQHSCVATWHESAAGWREKSQQAETRTHPAEAGGRACTIRALCGHTSPHPITLGARSRH